MWQPCIIYIYMYMVPPPGLSTSFGVNMPARVFRAMGTVPMHPEYIELQSRGLNFNTPGSKIQDSRFQHKVSPGS